MKLSIYIFYTLLIFTLSCCTHLPNTEKTLVAWVSLTDTLEMEGSVISLRDGERFDGIFLSAEDGGRWIAGSEDNKRTIPGKGISLGESDRTGEIVQLAVVYTDSKIFMYRNGDLKSSYPAENIDLLNSEENFVLFGMDRFGGEAHISEAIEDARIYDKALTENDIKSLKPNEASNVTPYAWWNFEDDNLVEQTGRYSYYNRYGLTFRGFELKEGKLFVNRWGHIIALRDYVPETPERPENLPENWLTFYLAHPGPGIGFPGDPNPAYFV